MAALLNDHLRRSGYIADRVGTISEATEALAQYQYPMMLLDRRLPDGDGASILQFVRSRQLNVRVMFVTALRSIDERVDGLDAGADDYLSKPFDVDELLARMRAVLRRPTTAPTLSVTVGDLSFDLNQRMATVRGLPFIVPKREMLLLEALVRYAGRVVRHNALMSEIYGLNDSVQFDALKMSVSRLRQRLKECGAGVEIHTLRGIGYILTVSQS